MTAYRPIPLEYPHEEVTEYEDSRVLRDWARAGFCFVWIVIALVVGCLAEGVLP